jgi:hypothetical protein
VKLADALNIISEDVISSDEQLAYSRLVEYVYARHKKIEHLSYTQISKVMQIDRPDVLLRAAQYFSGERVKLLQMKFELIFENSIFLLGSEAVHDAEETGELIHPVTGNPVPNYEQHVFPFFVPSCEIGNG